MPATAKTLGVEDRFDASANLSAGADYLARQLLPFGDLRLALAAYNAGPDRVARLGRIPNFPETQAYVTAVVDCYLPWKEVARATGLSRTTAWRLQKRGEFPVPYAISPGRVGYREDEVEAWRVSRDHSGGRVMRPTEILSGPAVAGVSPAEPARTAVAGPTVAGPSGAAPVATRPAAAAFVASSSVERAVRAKRGKPNRRRSQHAQSIAQQILFDF